MPDDIELKSGELPDAWERRPDETAKAFRAFQFYLVLDADRSVLKVARKCAVHQNVIKRWSARYNWVERAKCFDSEQAKHRLERLAVARANLVDAQVACAERMMGVVQKSLPRLARGKLNAQDTARIFVAVLKSLQAVFGKDEPLSERKPTDIKVVVQTNVPRHPQYDFSKLSPDLQKYLPEYTKPKPKGDE